MTKSWMTAYLLLSQITKSVFGRLRLSFVITKELREKMHLLTYTWLRAKHYNTQNDSASLPVLRR